MMSLTAGQVKAILAELAAMRASMQSIDAHLEEISEILEKLL